MWQDLSEGIWHAQPCADQADSLVLGLGKETSLRHKVKMSKGMDSSPNMGFPQPCWVLPGFQQILMEAIEASSFHWFDLTPTLVLWTWADDALLVTSSPPFFSQLPVFFLVKDCEKAPSHWLHWTQRSHPRASLKQSCFPRSGVLCPWYEVPWLTSFWVLQTIHACWLT